MTRRGLLAIAWMLAGVAGVAAQPVSGLYVSGAGGANLRAPQSEQTRRGADPLDLNGGQPGAAGVGSVGYGFGNGLRMEIEGGRRR